MSVGTRVYIYFNQIKMADCTMKDSIWMRRDLLHVFLFSSEKLEKQKYLTLVAPNLQSWP